MLNEIDNFYASNTLNLCSHITNKHSSFAVYRIIVQVNDQVEGEVMDFSLLSTHGKWNKFP